MFDLIDISSCRSSKTSLTGNVFFFFSRQIYRTWAISGRTIVRYLYAETCIGWFSLCCRIQSNIDDIIRTRKSSKCLFRVFQILRNYRAQQLLERLLHRKIDSWIFYPLMPHGLFSIYWMKIPPRIISMAITYQYVKKITYPSSSIECLFRVTNVQINSLLLKVGDLIWNKIWRNYGDI